MGYKIDLKPNITKFVSLSHFCWGDLNAHPLPDRLLNNSVIKEEHSSSAAEPSIFIIAFGANRAVCYFVSKGPHFCSVDWRGERRARRFAVLFGLVERHRSHSDILIY